MAPTRDNRNPIDVTRDRYESTARLLKLIAAHVDRKLTNTRPAFNIRHDWTDVGTAEHLMNDVWEIAGRLFYDQTGGHEEEARLLAMRAAFEDITEQTNSPRSA